MTRAKPLSLHTASLLRFSRNILVESSIRDIIRIHPPMEPNPFRSSKEGNCATFAHLLHEFPRTSTNRRRGLKIRTPIREVR